MREEKNPTFPDPEISKMGFILSLWFPFLIFFYLGFKCKISFISITKKSRHNFLTRSSACSENRIVNLSFAFFQPFFTCPSPALTTPPGTLVGPIDHGFIFFAQQTLDLHLTPALSSHLAFLPSTCYFVQIRKVENNIIFSFVLCVCFFKVVFDG